MFTCWRFSKSEESSLSRKKTSKTVFVGKHFDTAAFFVMLVFVEVCLLIIATSTTIIIIIIIFNFTVCFKIVSRTKLSSLLSFISVKSSRETVTCCLKFSIRCLSHWEIRWRRTKERKRRGKCRLTDVWVVEDLHHTDLPEELKRNIFWPTSSRLLFIHSFLQHRLQQDPSHSLKRLPGPQIVIYECPIKEVDASLFYLGWN